MNAQKLRVVSDRLSAPAFSPNYTYDDWLEDLRGLIWDNFIKNRQTIEEVAAAANLHVKTVDRFIFRDTKRPTGNTIYQLAQAIGFRMPLIACSAPRQPDEHSHKKLHRFIRSRPSK